MCYVLNAHSLSQSNSNSNSNLNLNSNSNLNLNSNLAGQAKELTRLELSDLRDRYGPLVGKRKFPSIFLVAVEDEEFVG